MSNATRPKCLLVAVLAALLWTDAGGWSRTPSNPFGPGTAFAQIDAGYLADVQDLQQTVTYSSTENRTDVSLSLVPLSPAGDAAVTLVFRASFGGRTQDLDTLSGIVVRAHYRVLSDDRIRSARAISDTHALNIRVASRDAGTINLFFYPLNWGYGGFSAPGDEIPVAYFTMTRQDLGALAIGDAVSGQVLWTDFVLTPPQVEALRAFAAPFVADVGP